VLLCSFSGFIISIACTEMGSGASSAGPATQENAFLGENEAVDQTRVCVPVIKGSPASRSGYDIGYKIGEYVPSLDSMNSSPLFVLAEDHSPSLG
jgi:hypothetical protein